MKEMYEQKQKRARIILRRLKKQYGTDIGPFVNFSNPLELVMGTILSAQCTDDRVNAVTETLFARYRTAQDYADADIATLEMIIRPTGFYHQKARSLKETGRIIAEHFGGRVPNRVDDLLTLRGVSYKTAHLIMAKAYGQNTGVAVDTHVNRLTRRLELSVTQNPTNKGRELAKLYLKKDYLNVNEYFIMHGRSVCKARKPQCKICILADLCPRANGKTVLPRARRVACAPGGIRTCRH